MGHRWFLPVPMVYPRATMLLMVESGGLRVPCRDRTPVTVERLVTPHHWWFATEIWGSPEFSEKTTKKIFSSGSLRSPSDYRRSIMSAVIASIMSNSRTELLINICLRLRKKDRYRILDRNFGRTQWNGLEGRQRKRAELFQNAYSEDSRHTS